MVGTWGDVGGLMRCLLAGSWRVWSYGFGLGLEGYVGGHAGRHVGGHVGMSFCKFLRNVLREKPADPGPKIAKTTKT